MTQSLQTVADFNEKRDNTHTPDGLLEDMVDLIGFRPPLGGDSLLKDDWWGQPTTCSSGCDGHLTEREVTVTAWGTPSMVDPIHGGPHRIMPVPNRKFLGSLTRITEPCRCTSLTNTRTSPRPYRRPMPGVLWGSWGVGVFL